jgi:hypothetical protein
MLVQEHTFLKSFQVLRAACEQSFRTSKNPSLWPMCAHHDRGSIVSVSIADFDKSAGHAWRPRLLPAVRTV